jgi:DNA-binding transcriptional ArsR family regulator
MTHDDMFQTLADPTRRRVIAALKRGEQSVNQIVTSVGIHQSGVSRHLAILSAGGFVTVRSEGSKRYYSLRPQPFRELAAWLNRYTHVWERRKYIRVTRRTKPRA